MSLSPFSTIKDLQTALKEKKVTPDDIIRFYRERFSRYDGVIGSALEIFESGSIASDSSDSGSLYGIPGLIKDTICQKDRITSCASKILSNYRASYDATAVNRLKNQGALLMGRANCDEFAMGSSTETSAYQLTRNPWNTDRVPGGSSGGSAAAVAAGLVPFALGTETGGSVRQPAAFCGLVGLKPTYGLISRYGLVAYASSLDQIGTFTHTAYDAAIVLSAIAGNDERDSSTRDVGVKDYTAALDGKMPQGLKIGVIDNAMNADGVDSEVRSSIDSAIATFESLGATVKRVTIPSMDYAAAVYFILSRAEAASNLARYDGVRYGVRSPDADTLFDLYTKTREEGFGKEVKARILLGNFALSVGQADQFYGNACKVQRLMKKEFNDIFADVDVLISPVSPTEAFKFNAFADNKLQMDLQDYFTCAANITGIPALSVPCGFTKNNLPVGFQIMGPALADQLLLQVAHAYQHVTDWHTKHPEL